MLVGQSPVMSEKKKGTARTAGRAQTSRQGDSERARGPAAQSEKRKKRKAQSGRQERARPSRSRRTRINTTQPPPTTPSAKHVHVDTLSHLRFFFLLDCTHRGQCMVSHHLA
jgi:hypothetical protein